MNSGIRKLINSNTNVPSTVIIDSPASAGFFTDDTFLFVRNSDGVVTRNFVIGEVDILLERYLEDIINYINAIQRLDDIPEEFRFNAELIRNCEKPKF